MAEQKTGAEKQTGRSWKLNMRIVAAVVVLPVIIAVGIYFLHRMQVNRNASDLLERAAAAESDHRLQEAVSLLSQYIRLKPEDTDALVRIGTLVNRIVGSVRAWRRAYISFEEVLRREPEREDAAEIRWQLVQVAMKLNRFRDAMSRLKILRDSEAAGKLSKDSASEQNAFNLPDEAELCFLQGQCRHGVGDYLAAFQYFLASIQLAGDRVDSYETLVTLILQRPESLPAPNELQDEERLKLLDNM